MILLNTKTKRESEIRKAIKLELARTASNGDGFYQSGLRYEFRINTDSGWSLYYMARIERIAGKILFDIRPNIF